MVSNPTSRPVTVPVSNPAALVLATPVSIHPGQTPWYIHVSHGRVEGALPDIETMTNLANPADANITQPTAAARPHLISEGGKDYADVNTDIGNVFWEKLGLTVPLWVAGETDLTLYWVGSFDDLTTNRYIFDFGLTTFQTGFTVQNLTSNRVRVVIHANGSTAFANYPSVVSDGPQFWRGRYDGANITLQRNGVEVATAAKTGGMTNDCDDMTVGHAMTSSFYAKSKIRTAALIVGPTTPAQDAASLIWGLGQV